MSVSNNVANTTISSTIDTIAFVKKHLEDTVPRSRELSLALTKLDEAKMWLNAIRIDDNE